MSFRTRILAGLLAVVLVPLAVFGLGVRRAMTDRVTAQYQRRVAALVTGLRADLDRAGADIGARLDALQQAIADDNRFRLAALQGADRAYLLDYAGGAMRLAGLTMLQIQDSTGRIVSSGHFRNEFDRLDPALPHLLAAVGGAALVETRTAEGPILVLARVDSFRLGGRRFSITGGVAVDSAFFAGLARDGELRVSLFAPADSTDQVAGELPVPYVAAGDPERLAPARIVVTHSLASLAALRRGVDLWFLAGLVATGVAALLLAGWLSSRLSRPLAALAERTAAIDVDRLDVTFESDRDDEIGALTRLLGAMTERLRAGAAKLREAERRLAIGDLARQVNHDIKNGLIPIRNVFRHLAQVAGEQPERLPAVFAERQGTLESSVSYLETLAGNYARLSPEPARQRCDVNAIVSETARRLGDAAPGTLELALAEALPPVVVDPVALRRVLENLIGNAVDSLGPQAARVTVATEPVAGGDRSPGVRISVADTGKGMTQQQLDRAFEGFYTTKPGGTGLGLAIVRRLVLDAGGGLKVETAPGKGTKCIVELPGDGT